ncbi:hypothetical protein NHQ30_004994 [Ciborinia camelliae]|nr:hypothetical protein NHQ30_004994 [Ciborinia camelliae]
MHFSMIAATPLLFLSALASAAETPVPAAVEAANSTQIYYLVNCFNNMTGVAYAEVDYFPTRPSSPAGQTPTKKAIINTDDSIDYEDGTWTATTPFNITAVIGKDAQIAKPDAVVGSANASTCAKTLSCVRLKRFVLYEPKFGERCYTDFACQES